MKRVMLHRFIASLLHHFITSSLHRCQHYISTQKSPKNRAKLSNIYVKAKAMMFFGFATETTKRTNFWGNCHWDSSLHRFFAFIFLFVKAFRQ
jgi:hypothetical protein